MTATTIDFRPAATRVIREGRFRYSAWALVPDSVPGHEGPWFFVARAWTRRRARRALRAFVRAVAAQDGLPRLYCVGCGDHHRPPVAVTGRGPVDVYVERDSA